MIKYRELFGAYEDRSIKFDTTFNFLDFRSLYSTPKSRVRRSEEFLDQEEFQTKSKYCTLYASWYSFVHWFGYVPSLSKRLDSLQYILSKGFIDEDKGGNPLIVAGAFVDRFNQQSDYDYTAKISYFIAGSQAERMLMTFGGHGFITGFTITKKFVNDREDNLLLDASVHGGRRYGGHAVFESMIKPLQLIVMNNYPNRRENHFGIEGKENIDKRYDHKYHYKYSALITYWKK